MRSFYKTYPVLPAKDKGLSWSHYRNLLVVKSDEKRKYLEDLVVEKKLGSNELQRKISAEKKVKKKKSKPKSRKLKFTRGVLFTYKLVQLAGSKKTFVDCGFNIFTEIKTSLRGDGEVVSSVKNGEKISLKVLSRYASTGLGSEQLHTYKAYLDKVVDGDTIHVTLDLGFKIRHKEILRLAKINSPEAETFEGKKSSDELKKILADVPFLIVKTNKTDIYGRYIADVFLAGESEGSTGESGRRVSATGKSSRRVSATGKSSRRVSATVGVNNFDAEKVASEGMYLNQMLIDLGAAEVF